jgi:predicted nucleic acid-binding Zn ribbon protein
MAYRNEDDEHDLDDPEAPDEADQDEGGDEDDATAETVPCPHCGKAIYEEAEVCPHCGAFVDREARAGRSPWVFVTAIVLVAAILLGWVASMGWF